MSKSSETTAHPDFPEPTGLTNSLKPKEIKFTMRKTEENSKSTHLRNWNQIIFGMFALKNQNSWRFICVSD